MGGAHRIDIKGFHQFHIADQLVPCHGIAILNAGIVVIHTLDLDQFIIEKKMLTINADVFEANIIANAHDFFSVFFYGQIQRIQGGNFGVPLPNG